MKIFVFDQQNDISIHKQSVEPIIKEILLGEGNRTDEMSVHFVTTEEISRLHGEFFSDPSPTDCISFPIDDPHESTYHHVLGEVFICPKTAIDFILKSEKQMIYPKCYQEMTLYLVHGVLHLLGYDDLEAGRKREMRSAESKYMDILIAKNVMLHS